MFNLIGLIIAFFGLGIAIAGILEMNHLIAKGFTLTAFGMLIDYVAFRRRIMKAKEIRKNGKKK